MADNITVEQWRLEALKDVLESSFQTKVARVWENVAGVYASLVGVFREHGTSTEEQSTAILNELTQTLQERGFGNQEAGEVSQFVINNAKSCVVVERQKLALEPEGALKAEISALLQITSRNKLAQSLGVSPNTLRKIMVDDPEHLISDETLNYICFTLPSAKNFYAELKDWRTRIESAWEQKGSTIGAFVAIHPDIHPDNLRRLEGKSPEGKQPLPLEYETLRKLGKALGVQEPGTIDKTKEGEQRSNLFAETMRHKAVKSSAHGHT